MGRAVPGMDRVALYPGDCQTRHRPCLPSEGISIVLDLEGSTRQARAAGGFAGDSRPDPPPSRENPGWGVPRIYGELLKLGINIGETSVSK
jgi:hypothetical protein